jgi:DNA-binding NarL/FixJ family response regulator
LNVLDGAPLDRSRERPPLSPRELEVLEMTAQGMTNPAIARELRVSVHAIKFHLASIYRKLGVANRTEAAVAFLQPGPRA